MNTSNLIITLIKNINHHAFGKCAICGKKTIFLCISPEKIRNNMYCIYCRGSSRNRHVAKIICETFGSNHGITSLAELLYLPDQKIQIYNTTCVGPIHKILSGSNNYICSMYLKNANKEFTNSKSIRNEDLQNLNFKDNTFDLIITEDVFEHIRKPYKAFQEIKRVLKPGGYHIFTVPLNISNKSIKRIDVSQSEKDTHLLPPAYHGDNIRNGALVYNDFGRDLFDFLDKIELRTESFQADYSDHKHYHIYNSRVFRSRKSIGIKPNNGLNKL